MKVKVEEVSPIERRLSIEVDAPLIAQELTNAYGRLAREVKIPGFRPGKVPRRILEQKFKADVETDVIRRVEARAFLDAIKEHKVEAVAEPHISSSTLNPNAPYAFTARVEVKPVLEAKDYKGLKLAKVDASVPEEKVTEQLTKMQQNFTTLEKIEGRDVAKLEDMAVIDFNATVDGKEFPGNKGTDITVEVAPGELIDANLPQIEGMKVGETKPIDYKFPDTYRVEEVKGKTATFTVTLKELKEKKVPPLDDALAEKLGSPTFVELKEKIRKDLERAANTRTKNDEREAMFKALVEKNPFDLPQAMTERGIDMMLEGALRAIQRGGVDPRQLGLDFNKLREDFRPKAELEVRGQLIVEAIGKQEKIEVSDAELEKKLEELAEEGGQALSTVRKYYKDEEERQGLVSRVREQKTIEFLKSQATYS
jgi:trigger factor